MRKLSILIVCLSLLLSLSSCGNSSAEMSEITDGSKPIAETSNDVLEDSNSIATNNDPTTEENDAMLTNRSSSLVQATHKCSNGQNINYWLYTPDNPGNKMPLVVYLHGGTSKGNNLDLLMQHEGFPQYIQQKKLRAPAYIVMPQAAEDIRAWDEMNDEVIDLVLHIIEEYDIDKKNVSLTGHSMGGIGTWLIGHSNPEIFSRIAPLSGTVSRRLKDRANEIKMPVWSFVGTEQSDSNAYNSNVEFFPQLEQHNANTQLTILQGYGHKEVVRAYLEYDITGWLIGLES